jgi:hypothetical protein
VDFILSGGIQCKPGESLANQILPVGHPVAFLN